MLTKNFFLIQIGHIINRIERNLGIDVNGDGYIGGESKYISVVFFLWNWSLGLGYLGWLERAYRIDINGDGRIGQPYDVLPGFPAAYGYPSVLYGPGGHIFATNNPVRTSYGTRY